MRIAYLIDGLRPGGKERQTVELLNGFIKHGNVSVLLVCLGGEDFFESALRSEHVRFCRIVRNSRWDLRVVWKLYKLIREFKADLIHTTCWMTSFYGLIVARALRRKLVNGSIRNAFRQRSVRWRIEKVLLQWSDFRVANSVAGLTSRSLSPEHPRNRVVYNGFDFGRLEHFDGSLAASVFSAAQGRRIVGMVAQFKDDKDYETYFKAAELLLARRTDVMFLAVGDGNNLPSFQERFANSAGRIVFLGRQTLVETIVSTFDVGVLATFTEGVSNSVMEYMALGKPVVVSEGGGSSELVVHGETGFLVPPRDPRALADRIGYCLDFPDTAAQMGEAGRRRLATLFSRERLVQNTFDLYRLALGHAPTAGIGFSSANERCVQP